VFEATDISVHFGGVVAVDQVSLALMRREVVGLIGPNGSGKSTFINAVTGLVPATGRLTVDGHPVKLGRAGRVARLGVLRTFQTPQIHDQMTCLENVLVGLSQRNLRSVPVAWFRRRAMMKTEREHWATAFAALGFVRLQAKTQVPAKELSFGERRRLELARVYAAQPRVLFLDEPAAGLNQRETAELVRLLQNWAGDNGPALLIVEHKIDFLERLCDRIVVLELGRQIAAGEPAAVWADPRVMDAYLGMAAHA
jgi:ABC-type branched-subunit amino acid transport system ATPase component